MNNKQELKHFCHSCLYRHGSHHGIKDKCKDFYKTNDYKKECPDWKIGLCYSCKNNTDDINEDEDKIDEWFKRGCETWCMSGCKKYRKKWWWNK